MIQVLLVPVKGPIVIHEIQPHPTQFAALLGGEYKEASVTRWEKTVGAYVPASKVGRRANGRAAALLASDIVYGPVLFFGSALNGPPQRDEAGIPQTFLRYVAYEFRGQLDLEIKPEP